MKNEFSAAFWVDELGLLPHPEGGFYKELYRAMLTLSRETLPASFRSDKKAATSIYYLLEAGDFSAFHRIASDEIWHYHAGDVLEIYEILEDGSLIRHLLGRDPRVGQQLQVVIGAGNWFASRPAAGSDYCLAGCIVAPGFDFEDFEMADAAKLAESYPAHAALIRTLTR